MVSFVVTYLPNYLLLARLELLNTLPGLVLPILASGFGTFLLRQHFKSFPQSTLEAPQMDPASSWQMLWRILVPANILAIAALAVYVFVGAWNQFVWPMTELLWFKQHRPLWQPPRKRGPVSAQTKPSSLSGDLTSALLHG